MEASGVYRYIDVHCLFNRGSGLAGEDMGVSYNESRYNVVLVIFTVFLHSWNNVEGPFNFMVKYACFQQKYNALSSELTGNYHILLDSACIQWCFTVGIYDQTVLDEIHALSICWHKKESRYFITLKLKNVAYLLNGRNVLNAIYR